MRKIFLILFIFYSGLSMAQNIGVNNTNPVHAKLEINGSVGAAVAMFGADKFGVTIEADNPEIGFNYFYNNGQKTIKAGYASVIGMNPGTGELYIGNFNGNQSVVDFGAINGYRQNLTLYQNGEFRIEGTVNSSHFYYGGNEDTYIRGGKNSSNIIIGDLGGRTGVGVYPVRSGFEQNGVVGNTAAIFGGEGTGVSIQRDWPAIGLNQYYDGTHRAIGIGYGAQIAVDQTIGAAGGAITFTTFSPRVNAVNGPLLNQNTNVFIQTGRIGVGTNVPEADITITNFRTQIQSDPMAHGLRLNNIDNVQGQFGGTWNIISEGIALDFWREGSLLAKINGTGTYIQLSDARLKNSIDDLSSNSLQKILLLRPVSYYMNTDKARTKKDIGFIAQEVEKVFPEAVSTVFDKDIKGISYSSFIPLLTKGIQEQQLQLAALQKENTALKERMEKLEQLILDRGHSSLNFIK